MLGSRKNHNKRSAALKRKIFKKLKSKFPIYIDRICKDCGKLTPCHHNYTCALNGRVVYRTRCNTCYRMHVNHIRKHTTKARSLRRKKRILERKKQAVKYLGGKCSTCGYNKCLAALDFHHIVPKLKTATSEVFLDMSLAKFYAELDKCKLLCANCHREFHYLEKL